MKDAEAVLQNLANLFVNWPKQGVEFWVKTLHYIIIGSIEQIYWKFHWLS